MATLITRRNAIAAMGGLGANLMPAAASKPRLGAQTNAWAIRDFDELIVVLDKLKGYGYEGFETSFRNVQMHFDKPTTANVRMANSGLRFVNIHIFMDKYDATTHIAPADLIERVAKGGAALGAACLVVSGAPCVESAKLNEAAIQAKTAALNRAGTLCRGLGMSLAYHNHGPEFAERGLEIEALVKRTDPKLVDFVIDAGHAFRVGADVPAFFARHHRRIAGMHLRDFHNGDQVILGEGDFHLEPLARAIARARWTGWLMNEEERLNNVKLGDAAIGPARREMKKVFGV
ncbi:MAG: sugar phosphate isomerase/epimerase [Bryobacteraceae bacterium]